MVAHQGRTQNPSAASAYSAWTRQRNAPTDDVGAAPNRDPKIQEGLMLPPARLQRRQQPIGRCYFDRESDQAASSAQCRPLDAPANDRLLRGGGENPASE